MKNSSPVIGSCAWVSNNAGGAVNSNFSPTFTETPISSLSRERKNNSFPSCRHRGCCPPLVEIWYLPSFLGKRATYTSQRPDSLEEYATQRQSGENCPSLHYSIRAWVAVAEQGFFATASATVLWNWGLKRVPASQAVIFVNLEPLVGAILGVSLLHEDLGIMALAGGALILGGAMYFSYKPERGSP